MNLLNQAYPPLSTIEQQYISIEQSLPIIDSIQPHVGSYISKNMLDEYLPMEIKKAAEEYEDENIKIKSFNTKLDYNNQAININANFNFYLPKYNVNLTGDLNGITAISMGIDSLFVRSAFKTLKIKKIEFQEKPTLSEKVLAELIKTILDNFILNINREIFKNPSSYYLGWSKPLEFNAKNLFEGNSTQVTSPTKTIKRYFKQSVILIDKTGIMVIIELTGEKPEYRDLEKNNLKSYTQEQLNRIFKEYKVRFKSKWNNSFESEDAGTGISVHINKSVIAEIFNNALGEKFSLKSIIINDKEQFSEKIEVENSKIDCQKVRKPFNYNRYQRASCDWSCTVNTPLGSFDDPVCLANRAACNAAEEAKVAADNIKYEAEKAAHDILQESAVAACNIAREANNFMALGKISGYTLGTGLINLDFNKFYFNPDLTSIDISYTGELNYKLESELNIQPMDLGYVFLCQLNYNKSTKSNINVKLPSQTTTLTIKSKKVEDNIFLTTEFEPVKIDATISPSPLHDLFKDPKFFGSCSSFYSFLGWASGTAAIGNFFGFIDLSPETELMLMGKVKGEHQPDKIETKIEPIKFKINQGEDKKSEIYWNSKSIDFIYKIPNK